MREWLPSGTTVAGYQISSRLSAQGMGEVYLARESSSGFEVALKLLPASFVQDPKIRERLTKIYAEIVSLRHRNISEIYEGAVTEEGRPFVAMEYVKGQSLDLLGYGHQLSLNEVIALVIQIAEALEAAHARGLLHLAIKPANLMLTPGGQVKILDLGQSLAFPLSLFPLSRAEDPDGRLQVGLVAGRYLSPEQVAGERPDQRADIFSVGIVFYELLAGHPPFVGTSVDEVLAAVTLAQPLSLTEFREDLSPELNRIIAKALAKEVTARYQTTGELARDLRRLNPSRRSWAKLINGAETDQPLEQLAGRERNRAVADMRGRDVEGEAKADRFSPASFIADLTRALTGLLEGAHRSKAGPEGKVEILSSGASFADFLSVIKKNWQRILAITLAMIGVFVAIFIAGRLWDRSSEKGSPESIQFTRLTTNGKVTDAALSPDGRTLVYAVDESGGQALLAKELENSQERRLASVAGKEYHGLTFSPDGRWVGYVKSEPSNAFGDLYRLSLRGSAEEDLKTSRVVGTLSFSPDGEAFAFVRANETGSETALIIGSAEGGGKGLSSRRSPSFFSPGGVAWAPDGRVIAAVVKDPESGLYLKIVTFSVGAAVETTVASKRWSEIDRLAWLADGSGLIVTASEPASRSSQLWMVTYPSGEITRLTQDLSDYHGASLTADAKGLATVQSEALSNIWTLPSADLNRAQQLTTERYDGVNGLAWTPDQRIVFVSWAGGRETIWMTGSNANDHRPLPVAPEGGEGGEFHPAVSPDGRFLIYVVGRANGAYLWRSELDRRNLKRMSDESQVFLPSIAPSIFKDGQTVVYSVLRGGRRVVARSSIEGGPPVTLIEKQAWRPVISPDGAKVACNFLDESTARWKIAVFSMTGGEPMATFDAPGSFQRVIRWTPDGNGLAYLVTRDGVTNIWTQSLAGGEPKQLTNFRNNRIFDFVWSRDGGNIALAQGWVASDVVLIRNFR